MILIGADKEITEWVGKRTGISDFGPSVTMGVVRHGKILAGAVYNNYRHPGIEITFAMEDPRWASKQNIACILRYPFVQLGCLRVTATTRAKNDRARTFLTDLGFEQEGYHPYGFPDDDAVSYGLLKEKNRWMSIAPNVEIVSGKASAS